MPEQPMIRPERPRDVAAIELVTMKAFENAPHTSHTEHLIVNALRAANALTLSLVAEDEQGVLGHVAISPVTVSDGSKGWYGLGPVSVLPEWQGRGLGSALIRNALAQLRDSGAAGCVVLGEPGYYGRFGFEADKRLSLPGVPPEYFQALAFGTHRPEGEVAYHAAFEAGS